MSPDATSRQHFEHVGATMNIHLAGDFETDELIAYAQFWRNACVSFEDEKPMQILIAECAQWVSTRRFKEVQEAAKAGSAADLIDQGIR